MELYLANADAQTATNSQINGTVWGDKKVTRSSSQQRISHSPFHMAQNTKKITL